MSCLPSSSTPIRWPAGAPATTLVRAVALKGSRDVIRRVDADRAICIFNGYVFIVSVLSSARRLLFRGSCDVQQFRFFRGRTSKPLLAAWVLHARKSAELYRRSPPRGVVKGLNDLDVNQ